MLVYEVTHKAMKGNKVDTLSDYERRELDCWIAAHIEWHLVLHDLENVMEGSDTRLSDLAFNKFRRTHPTWVASTGPFRVARYSFSPAIALNVLQDSEYIEGWSFQREDSKWRGVNDGLKTPLCASFALCVMLALKKEYEFQNQKEKSHARIDIPTGD